MPAQGSISTFAGVPEVRSYAILGTGGLGGYFGARLHHAGSPAHFLLHSDYHHVVKNGLRVESKFGDFSIRSPQVYARAEDMPRCYVVLIATKSTHNHLLPHFLPPVVKPGGAVLVMQNGLGMEERVAAIVGPAVHVIGGMAFLCSHKAGPGHIRHLDYGQVRLGEYSATGQAAGITPWVRAIADDFLRAGVPVEMEEDLLLARWKKLVWNVPYNGLSVVMNATTDRLMADLHTRALCESLMREVVAGAAAFGRAIDESFIELMMTNTDKMVAYKPSMMLDHERGRPMEVEAIYGNPLRAAAARGVPLPRIESLYRQLKFLEKGLDASRGSD